MNLYRRYGQAYWEYWWLLSGWGRLHLGVTGEGSDRTTIPGTPEEKEPGIHDIWITYGKVEYNKTVWYERSYWLGYGPFTLPDPDSDKVSDSDNITIHSYGTHIRIGSRIGVGLVSMNMPWRVILIQKM